LTVGVPNEYFVSGVDEEVELQIKNFIIKLQELGVTVKNISLPHTKYALPCYYIVMPAEVSSNLARYDNIRYGTKVEELEDLKIKNLKEMYFKTRGNGFGKEVKRRILLGAYVLSKGYYDDYYLRAQKVRRLIKNDFDNAFEKVDIILTPTTPNVAFGFGEKNKDPISMYLSDIFTVPMNLAGVPAISLPLANNKAGLPIGLQLVGQFKQDKKLLKIAKLIEEIIK
jgi:aspartyl-tRNA(Asn)/glutamyl-tRNA(Gln) amidotransferase subunit A